MASPFVQVPTISINNRENRNEEEIINFFDDFFLCEKIIGCLHDTHDESTQHMTKKDFFFFLSFFDLLIEESKKSHFLSYSGVANQACYLIAFLLLQ